MNVKPHTGELGLCLSGGGFRASFYHIGALARMAELGTLHQVEVISTVSGGSIVGAAYYLMLKNLLERKADKDITPADYVELVKDLAEHFQQAVQKNLRMRTFANPLKNMRMGLPNYSRSDAIGELYEKYIYKPLLNVGKRRISMRDLLIHPAGHTTFHPHDETIGNRTRTHKVPILVLNATSLNSGHNWYFSATSMGEIPPRNRYFRDIDKKDRYARTRYEDITSRNPDFPLGAAVAASAGVPGLFPPMAVSKLYPKRRVQLVDGGVFDNQGVYGALNPDHPCHHFVVSDASGQNDACDNPDPRAVHVLGASSSVMSGRVREEAVNNLQEVHRDKVAYFHLTRGIFANRIEIIQNKGAAAQIQPQRDEKFSVGITSSQQDFGVHEEAQRALAHVRTDLDSFTDMEAGCLMADGYLMSEKPLRALASKLPATTPVTMPGNWPFSAYIDKLAADGKDTLTHLRIAQNKFLKPFCHLIKGTTDFGTKLMLILTSIPVAASLIAIACLINEGFAYAMHYSLWQVITDVSTFQQLLTDVAPAIYGLAVFYILSTLADRLFKGAGKVAGWLRKILTLPMTLTTFTVTRLILPAIFALPVVLYVYTLDRYYVRHVGKLKSNPRTTTD